MKTTAQWLQEIKADKDKLHHWLERQYIGECLAASRIKELQLTQQETKFSKVLAKIADDELRHSEWVLDLLTARGITAPAPTYDGTRYWKPILKNIHDFEDVAAAGHHAEAMRLIRIEALANDAEIDDDIREVFARILPDEKYHSLAFEAMSTPQAIESALHNHNKGLDLLGLEI